MITANGSLTQFFLLFWVWVSTRKNCYNLHSKRWYLTTFFNLLLFCSVLHIGFWSIPASTFVIRFKLTPSFIDNEGRTADALFILVGSYYFIFLLFIIMIRNKSENEKQSSFVLHLNHDFYIVSSFAIRYAHPSDSWKFRFQCFGAKKVQNFIYWIYMRWIFQ